MEEDKHLVEMFQCTKEQYDNRENLEPKKLNSEGLISIEQPSTKSN